MGSRGKELPHMHLKLCPSFCTTVSKSVPLAGTDLVACALAGVVSCL